MSKTNTTPRIKDYRNICVLENADSKLHQAFYTVLSVKGDKLWFNRAYKLGKWDGYYRFYNKQKSTFPAGLLHLIKRRFPNIPVISGVQSPCPIDIDKIKDLQTLSPRNDQLIAIKNALVKKRGIIQWPTGAGKTVGIAMICNAIADNILVLVHTKNLLIQTSDVIERELGEEIGKIGAGLFSIKRITVGIIASVKTLSSEELSDFNCIILDESHHASANTFYSTIIRCSAYYRFGFSADPLDEHSVKSNSQYKQTRILGCFGPIISLTSVKQMKKEGIIATPKIKFLRIDNSYPGEKNFILPYDKAYCKYYCHNVIMHDKIIRIVSRHKNESILIIVKHIHHGKNLQNTLTHNNINCQFLSGEEKSSFIQEKIKEFKDKKLKVLIGSPIFNEGVDMPNVDVLIMAAGDIAATKQRLGRSLRKKTRHDNTVRVYDFFLVGNKHTERHAKRRIQIYKNEGHEII
ncbi:hypothetical protein CL622_05445 [archaeon]|nr:hypothetical protein [archaeon]